MTNLYYSFEQNVLANNITGINYDAARLTRVLLIFDPLEPVDEELDRIQIPAYEPDPDVLVVKPNANHAENSHDIEKKKEPEPVFVEEEPEFFLLRDRKSRKSQIQSTVRKDD